MDMTYLIFLALQNVQFAGHVVAAPHTKVVVGELDVVRYCTEVVDGLSRLLMGRVRISRFPGGQERLALLFRLRVGDRGRAVGGSRLGRHIQNVLVMYCFWGHQIFPGLKKRHFHWSGNGMVNV